MHSDNEQVHWTQIIAERTLLPICIGDQPYA